MIKLFLILFWGQYFVNQTTIKEQKIVYVIENNVQYQSIYDQNARSITVSFVYNLTISLTEMQMLIALCTGMQKQMFHLENIARLKLGF